MNVHMNLHTGSNAIVNLPEVLDEVAEAFDRYEQALVANDLDTLAELFWESKYTLRFGAEGSLYGHESIVAFRAARPSGPTPRRISGFGGRSVRARKR